MRYKNGISIVLGFIMMFSFLQPVFGQREKEVMKKYDYSSPRASYESLKKAIQNKDVEGIIIHYWNIGKNLSGNNTNVVPKFEDFLNQTKMKESDSSLIKSVENWYSDKGWIRLEETNFLKESSKEHGKEGNVEANYCFVTVERKTDGVQLQLQAINPNGTNEWWIFIYPGGE